MDRISRLYNKDVNFRPKMDRVWSRHSINERIKYTPPESTDKLSVKNLERINYSGLCGNCHLTVRHDNTTDFENTTMPFKCNRGHLMCQKCVQHFNIQSDKSCNLCGSESSNSYSSFESLTDNSNLKLRNNDNSNYCETDNSSQNQNNINKNEYQPSVSSSVTKLISQMTNECSRRPIRCPRLDCAVNVAFSSLTHHFLFDHPEVPILSIEPNNKTTLIVSFSDLPCDSSLCIALLLVSNKLSGTTARLFNGNHIHPNYRDRLPLPVLISRLNTSGQKNDVIIAWIAGLDIASVGLIFCSIQVIDSIDDDDDDKVRSLTYTGPINSLKTAQKPQEVFNTGDCIVLHEGLLKNLMINSTNFYVNIVIH
ncbi:hypothetical protein HCN44_007533 [Aphidius gifuensis]|uniref:DUF4729 domain-containing protein n=1 Tax=Aphidius gifuensis TaxID=684658 RepID=A0A835CM58_APHGI|nr:bromodomain-containing protein DDB_G0270170-like [Aphidius gifuensis]KAF7988039.1 hypothetical protein HCN44_007533 [Aphidius gifuensis]